MTRYVQLSLVSVLLSVPLPLLAGDLNSSAAPGSTNSYTIGDICNRLDSGTAGVQIPFREPTVDPAPTGCTLNDIMSKAPVADNISGALLNEVLFGKTFWGLRTDGTWGLQTGTLASQTPTNTTVAQPAGNYSAFNLSTVDTDLATGNVKNGVTIFGIAGDSNVVDTSSGDAMAGEILSGKKAWVDGSEVTGTLATRIPTNTTVNQPAGNYNAFNLSTVDTDLAAGNVKSGVTIFGIAGDSNVVDTSSGDAMAGEILSGKKAWVDGSEVTGTLATRIPTNTTVNQSAGNYNAFNLSTVDTDLATGNVKSGVTIFGINGNSNVVDTSSGNATAGDIKCGKTAWVDGVKISGRHVEAGQLPCIIID